MTNRLGEELRSLRESKKESLRQVEKLTGISNGFLSQLETGKVAKPAPHVLHKLSTHYGVPYQRLMELAGYLKKASGDENLESLTPLQVELMHEGEDLTSEEMKAVAAFIRFIRAERESRNRR